MRRFLQYKIKEVDKNSQKTEKEKNNIACERPHELNCEDTSKRVVKFIKMCQISIVTSNKSPTSDVCSSLNSFEKFA